MPVVGAIGAAILAAGYPYFFAVILLHPSRVAVGEAVYTAAVAFVLLAFAAGRRNGHTDCEAAPPGLEPSRVDGY